MATGTGMWLADHFGAINSGVPKLLNAVNLAHKVRRTAPRGGSLIAQPAAPPGPGGRPPTWCAPLTPPLASPRAIPGDGPQAAGGRVPLDEQDDRPLCARVEPLHAQGRGAAAAGRGGRARAHVGRGDRAGAGRTRRGGFARACARLPPSARARQRGAWQWVLGVCAVWVLEHRQPPPSTPHTHPHPPVRPRPRSAPSRGASCTCPRA